MQLSFCKPDAYSVEKTLVPNDGYMEIEKALVQLSSIPYFRQRGGNTKYYLSNKDFFC